MIDSQSRNLPVDSALAPPKKDFFFLINVYNCLLAFISSKSVYGLQLWLFLKGQCHKIFNPLLFGKKVVEYTDIIEKLCYFPKIKKVMVKV